MRSVPPSEAAYDRMRLRQWSRGVARSAGIERRDLLRFVAAASVTGLVAAAPARAADSPAPGIVKPLPPELFTVRGTNAETNFAALRSTGLLTPADRFFVRNHTVTPRIGLQCGWRLTVWGSGLTGPAVDFTYDQLRALPSVTRTAFVECAGNARSFYSTQQNQQVSGTAWTLGAIGTARWRGAAGGSTAAGGHRQERGRRVAARARQRGRQRRDEPGTGAAAAARREGAGRCGSRVRDERPTSAARPRVSGAPDRAVLGRYREHQVGRRHRGECRTPALPVEHRSLPAVRPRLPAGGQRAADPADAEERVRTGTRRVGSRASAPGAHGTFLVGRGPGAYRRGQHRRRHPMAARPAARRAAQRSWVRWSADWLPKERGPAVLLARATDRTGRTQPDVAVHNTQGYLFDAVVRHGVHVV